MAGKRKRTQKKASKSRMVIHERFGDDKHLKKKIKALSGFPDLKVKDWMPVVMAHYHLEEKLPISDERYWKMHDFCKGAKIRRNKKRNGG